MAGLDNLKGKRAAPFVKGGGRSKKAPRDAKGRARKVLARAKARKSADLSNLVDLAFRFRHGWIPIGGGGADKAIGMGSEGHSIRITHKDGTKALYRRTSKHNKGGAAKYENVSGAAASLNPGQMAAHIRNATAIGAHVEHHLSTPTTGSEIDLDWASWNANHKNVGRGFKKSAGLTGRRLGTKSIAIAQQRVTQPGHHFRAKAILAAESGNTALANKFLAKRAANQARLAGRRAAKMPAAPAARVAATRAPAVAAAPKPPAPTFTKKQVARRSVRKIARMGATNKRAAMRSI